MEQFKIINYELREDVLQRGGAIARGRRATGPACRA